MMNDDKLFMDFLKEIERETLRSEM